jgi:hypothetical protein
VVFRPPRFGPSGPEVEMAGGRTLTWHPRGVHCPDVRFS